ncbi:hypothetical protein Dimus_037920 [Dionaea muscipula]
MENQNEGLGTSSGTSPVQKWPGDVLGDVLRFVEQGKTKQRKRIEVAADVLEDVLEDVLGGRPPDEFCRIENSAESFFCQPKNHNTCQLENLPLHPENVHQM